MDTQKAMAHKLTNDYGFRRDEFALKTVRDADGGHYVAVRSHFASSSHTTRMMNCLRSSGFEVARVGSTELEVA